MRNFKTSKEGINKEAIKLVLWYAFAIGLTLACLFMGKILLEKNDEINTLKVENAKINEEKERLINELEILNAEVEELESKIKFESYNSEYKDGVISALFDTNNDLSNQILEVAEMNDELNGMVKEKDETIKDLEDRVNVYEKYEYALYYGDERNDLTYEQIKLGEELMLEKGYDPDLLFGIIMVESNGIEDVVNTSSGATGYGQFMNRTGEYVYENLLREGNYNHYTTPKDGTTNIKMMVAYLDLLYTKYNGDIVKSIKEYCGSSTYSKAYKYLNRVNSKLAKTGKNVYNMTAKK